MCNFHVGQKVVCVDDRSKKQAIKWFEAFPEEAVIAGRIYTIKSVHLDGLGKEVLWLEEVSRAELSRRLYGDPMIGYGSWRFRPVVTRKTDISILEALLNTKPADKLIEA